METIDLVNESNKVVDEAERQHAIKEKLWRRAAGGLIVNISTDSVLCHKRSSQKDERPGFWVATFGGKMTKGETAKDASLRELYEEFGFRIKSRDVRYMGCFKEESRHQFEYVYLAVLKDKTEKVIKFDPNEVELTQWVPISTCISNLSNARDWYSYGYDLEILKKIQIKKKAFKTNPFFVQVQQAAKRAKLIFSR